MKIKEKVAKTATLQNVAGVAGFEPTNAGTKNRCLTTWRHPNNKTTKGASLKRVSQKQEAHLRSLALNLTRHISKTKFYKRQEFFLRICILSKTVNNFFAQSMSSRQKTLLFCGWR